MTKYTVADIERAVSAYEAERYDEKYSYYYRDNFYDDVAFSREPVLLPELNADARMIEREGGNEGDGDYMHVVFKVGNQFFKMTGYHNSWDSDEWDGTLEEVEPYEVTVTRYRPVS